MDKINVITLALGGVGTATGVAGTILGCVNGRAIKALKPLQSRMSVAESNINTLLNPTTVVVAPAAPAAGTQQAQQPAPQNP